VRSGPDSNQLGFPLRVSVNVYRKFLAVLISWQTSDEGIAAGRFQSHRLSPDCHGAEVTTMLTSSGETSKLFENVPSAAIGNAAGSTVGYSGQMRLEER
jgi:hypothetical protein